MMKALTFKKSLPFFLLICFVLILSVGTVNHAKAAQTEEQIQHIYDDAGLLSTSELKTLEEMCITYGEDAGLDIIILTHENPNAVDAEQYIEDFYDEMVYGDSVILLVDMYNRDICLMAFGDAQSYIHSKRGDVIIDGITPYLGDGDYVAAFKHYIEQSAGYMKDTSDPNYDHEYIYDTPDGSNNSSESKGGGLITSVWFQLVAAIIIGFITVSVMTGGAGGKMTAGANTYMDQSHSGLIGRRDDYIRTTVTRVRKPEEPKNTGSSGGFNAGGFRGGVSSGGHSHSTSRGKF